MSLIPRQRREEVAKKRGGILEVLKELREATAEAVARSLLEDKEFIRKALLKLEKEGKVQSRVVHHVAGGFSQTRVHKLRVFQPERVN